MGFGLLFIGYFITFLMSVNNYGFAFRIVGYAVMFSAIGKLSEYKHKLSRTVLPLFLLSFCALFDAGRTLTELLSIPLSLFTESNAQLVSNLVILLSVIFQIMLLRGIRDIGVDAEAEKVPQHAVLCMILVCIVGAWKLAVNLLGTFATISDGTVFRLFALGAVLAGLLYPVVVLAFLFSCYAKICAPEDTDMAPRPSRFAFINRIREERQKKADEISRLREEYQKKLEEKANAPKSGKSKKRK